MKLIRLKLNEKFRSLQAGFEVHFLLEWDYEHLSEFNPYCLVGRNGSGKSNILEALAAIFYHIECIYLDYKPDDFDFSEEENPNGFKSEASYPDAYELEYLFPTSSPWVTSSGEAWLTAEGEPWESLDYAHIAIIKKAGNPPEVFRRNSEDISSDTSERKLSGIEVKEFLPTYILGYSSGENEILSLPFFKMRFIHYDEYVDRLRKGLDYMQAPEGRMVFLDKQFSPAILLCNFLLQPDSIAPFKEVVGLEAIEEFQIEIRMHHFENMHDDFLKGLSIEEASKETNQRAELTTKISSSIDKLRKCSTAHYYDSDTDSLLLDYWVNKATREAFTYHFGDALTLFQTFQILLTLNLYTVDIKTKKGIYQSSSLYVNDTIPVPPSTDRIMRFADFHIRKHGLTDLILNKALSDGEHQFLHTLGLCLLFKDQPNLFLLDEPETHLNPGWRANFITMLRHCLEQGNSKNQTREMLITSHSPFIVSDSREENVLIFEKDQESNIVNYRCPDFNTFGASVNQITMKVFNKTETIGSYAHSKLKELEKRFENGENGETLIKEANRLLGDSVEKIFFINRILDKIEKRR